jgi:hypothetical protein
MRAIQESVAKSRQAALERTLQRQAEEEAAQEAGCDMPGISMVIIYTYLVGGLEHQFFFPHIGNDDPN